MIQNNPVTKIILFKGEVAESYLELSAAIKQECGSIRMAQASESLIIRAAAENLLRFAELLNNPTPSDLDNLIVMKNRISQKLSLHKTS